MKVSLINIWAFNWLRYFTKCTLIAIKSLVQISYITSYVLFRARATVKFINSKVCGAIYNSLLNIVLIPISIFKLTSLLNILTNLATFTFTSNTFRFFGAFVINFCFYQIVLKGVIYTSTNHGRLHPKTVLCSSLGIRSICVSFKTFWKSLSNGWYIRLSTSQSSTWRFLSLLSNVFLDITLALRICSLTSFCLSFLLDNHFSNWLQRCHKRYSNIFGWVLRLDYKEST